MQNKRKPITNKTFKAVPLKQKRSFPNKKAKRIYWLKKIGFGLAICFAVGIIFTIGLFAWVSRELPDPDKLNERFVAESTTIYDKSGEVLLYETGKDVKRTSITIDDINAYVKYSTIALEDQQFYEHKGFQFKSFIRAVFRKATGGSMSATSTLTQQFIKNAIVGSERTYTRKIKEIILSIQLERKYSKDDILMMYLNEVGYGGVNYGVAAAANSYFGKSAKDLTLAEAASLAGLVQRPTYFLNNLDDLKWRRDYCIDAMLDQGYVTEEEATVAKTEDIILSKETTYKKAPHFVDYVISQLEDDYGSSFMNQGLKVITTLDWNKQEIAEQTISNHMDAIRSRGGSNASLVNIDTHTGQILSMVGSYDYYSENYDGQVNVAISDRQPGSSFKPLAYYAAFAKGYTPNTILYDLVTNFPIETGTYTPHNYSGGASGPVTMKKALGQSLNIPAVKTLYLAGVNTVLDITDALGYSTLKDRDRYGLALVLGGGEVKLLEHTSAFATFSREGERHPTSSILKVEDRKENILYEWKNQPSQVLDKNAAQTLNQALSDPANRYGFNELNITGHTVAAKTGTTQEYRDAWTMGYTPSFATGVWVGNNDNTTMNQGAAGLIVAAPIWNDYMSAILNNVPDETFNAPPPANPTKAVLWGDAGTTIKKKVDKITNKIVPDECVSSYPAEYLIEKEFKEAHNILFYVNKDDPNNTSSTGSDDPMFNAWESPVLEWAESQEDYMSKETEKENCSLRDDNQKPKIVIKTPSNNASVTNAGFLIKTSLFTGDNKNIKKVLYYIDSNIIDEKTFAPFDTIYAPMNLTKGKHVLMVTIFDDKGDEASDSITFDYKGSNQNSNTNSSKNSNTNKKKESN